MSRANAMWNAIPRILIVACSVSLFVALNAGAQDIQQESQQLQQSSQQSNQQTVQFWNDYIQKCQAAGGRIVSQGSQAFYCTDLPGTGGSKSQTNINNMIANEYMQLGSQMGSMLGDAINQWLQKHQMEKQQEEYRQAQMELERIQAEMARQQKWQQELAELDAQWVGPKPLAGEQPFQDMGSNFFGEYGGNRELAFAPPPSSSVTKSFSTAADQLRIANCLSKLAAQPGRSPEDAKFLSEQAAAAMSGQPVQVDTSGCQASAAPSQPAQAQTPLSQDQIACYTKLFETTNRNAERSVELAKELDGLERAVAQDQQVVQREQTFLSQLKLAAGGGPLPAEAGVQAPGQPYVPPCTAATRLELTRLIKGLPAQEEAIRRTESLLNESNAETQAALAEEQHVIVEGTLNAIKDAATDAVTESSALRAGLAAMKNAGMGPPAEIHRWLELMDQIKSSGEALESLSSAAEAGHKFGGVIKQLHAMLDLLAKANQLFVDSGLAEEIGGEMASGFGPVGTYSFKFANLLIDATYADGLASISSETAAEARDHLDVMKAEYREIQQKIAGLQARCEQAQAQSASGGAPQPPSNRLEEAQSALQRAQQAQANDEQALSRAQSEMNDLSLKLKQAESCPSPAQGEPSKPGL
ncbi:MAG TPA: hypothetical protein VEO19_03705 [Terriglobia bacterium]|nr:hypothetical protein [Terriglobia bacterium]